MSDHGFHVHGPHDHAVEHAAQHGNDNFASQIAVMTAVLSTVGALFGYQGGATQNEALIHKNTAAIRQTEAADKWAYYQAKGIKQNLAAQAAVLAPESQRESFRKDAERYKSEQADIKKEAERLEAESHAADALSEEAIHLHHRWAQSMTAIQIAISLAAITLLTRRKWLQYMAYGVAGLGALLGAAAALQM